MLNHTPESNAPVTLGKDEWLEVADDLLTTGPILQRVIVETAQEHPEMLDLFPALDPELFEADIRAAAVAVSYVAHFAADKCYFAIKEED